MRLISLIIFIFTCCSLHAQNLYNAGSVIAIGTNSVVYVKDTIINAGTIINNGDLQVGGSWINNAQYDAGQGQITFNSDQPQIINHNDQSFSRLTLSGGGEKLFLADITIENELNLTDGILTSENNSRIILSAMAAVTGGSDIAHIRGPVYHLGTGNKVFPVGNGIFYLPVELVNIEGSTPAIGITAVELDNLTLRKSSELKAVSTKRYWKVDVVSGSLANSLVVLPVRDEDIVSKSEDVVVAQSESLSENFESIGQSDFTGDVSNGKVSSKEFVSKYILAIATASPETGLVVHNAISPNDDDQNEFVVIVNIEHHAKNKFTLFNRWGDKVFEIENYDNVERVFRGRSNINGEKELSNGTYFYILETEDGQKLNGFLVLRN